MEHTRGGLWAGVGLVAAGLGALEAGRVAGSWEYLVIGVGLLVAAVPYLVRAVGRLGVFSLFGLGVAAGLSARIVVGRLGGTLGDDFGALLLIALGLVAASVLLATRLLHVADGLSGDRVLAGAFGLAALGGAWWIVADVGNQYYSFLLADILSFAGYGLVTAALFRWPAEPA